MIHIADPSRQHYADILTSNLQDFVREVRTIDLVDLVSFIRFQSFGAIEDLLQTSTELLFKEGTLTFAWRAGVDMDWSDIPTVTLGMEFRHVAVSVFFDLSLRAFEQSVVIAGILFDKPFDDYPTRALRLTEALADARLPRRVTLGSPALRALPGRGR